MPEWCDTPMAVEMPSMMMPPKMPVMEVMELPVTMTVKPPKEDLSTMMMAMMMKNAMKMANEMADNKMKMQNNMMKPMVMEEKEPCDQDKPQMPMMVMKPTMAPMRRRPEMMSEPLRLPPMMQMMSNGNNNAFPQNLMASGSMDKRA